ncbi:MAG: ComEC/Rec2 family competence protein [Actinomycetes bacterium]
MTDRWMVVTAGLVCLVAFLAPPVGLIVAGIALLIGLILRQPVLLSLGVVLIVGSRSSSSIYALQAPLSRQVTGVAQLMSDPEPQMFGTQLVLSLDGRRYLTTVSMKDSAVVRPLMMGEHIRVSGRAAELHGAPAGWVKARHLAGRLQLSSVSKVEGTAPWYRLANLLHRTLSAGADSLAEKDRALYLGLVMGDDRGQTDLMRFRFQASGLSHLLAVSGQNVAFLLAVASPLLRRMPQRLQFVGGLFLLSIFALVTRGEPSVLRAAVMAGIVMLSVATGRLATGTRILSSSVIILVLIDPLLVNSIGFQLSISATAGLLLMARPLADRLPGPDWLRLPLAVTLAAQLATAPVLIKLAGGIPAAATPANLLAVPAAGIVMMLGVTVGLFAGLLRDPIAHFIQIPSELLTRWIGWVARMGSQSALPLLRPVQLILITAGVLLALLLTSARVTTASGQSTSVRALRAVASIAAVGLLLLPCRPTSTAVGVDELAEGATLWVSDCGGRVLLVGAVTNNGDLLQGLWARGVRELDIVVVGSGSRAGRSALLVVEQFAVRRVLVTGNRSPPGMSALGSSSWQVGGVQVTATNSLKGGQAKGAQQTRGNASVPRVALSASACSF